MPHFFPRAAHATGSPLRLLGAAALVAGLATGAHAWELSVCADQAFLPQSNRNAEGYENRIIEMLAEHMGAEVTYLWWTISPSMIKDQLREGNCDLLIGMPDGGDSVLGTLAYYRSPYAFVYRADAGYDIATLDDPILSELQLGTTTEGTSTHLALARRGYLHNLRASAGEVGTNSQTRYTGLIESVVNGDIDVALPWGPVAGYFSAQHGDALKVVPVPEFDFPMIPMYHSIVMNMRMGDESLRDLLDTAIAEKWEEIYAILAEYHIPTLDMPRPRVTVEGQ